MRAADFDTGPGGPRAAGFYPHTDASSTASLDPHTDAASAARFDACGSTFGSPGLEAGPGAADGHGRRNDVALADQIAEEFCCASLLAGSHCTLAEALAHRGTAAGGLYTAAASELRTRVNDQQYRDSLSEGALLSEAENFSQVLSCI